MQMLKSSPRTRGLSIAIRIAREIEIGIRPGVKAWLDLSTRFGHVRSSLGAADGPGDSVTVDVQARTSAGDILVGRAGGDEL